MERTCNNIAILTFQSSNNYGALLQCYALCETLIKMGKEVSIINLNKEYIKDLEDLPFLPKNKLLIKKYINNKFFQSEFDVFRNKFLKDKFTKKLNSIKELDDFADKFDAVIVGSDQVWRYAYTKKTLKSFFLKFVSENTKKISYAASFGFDFFEGDKSLSLEIKNLLKRFNAVSVREDKGVEICKTEFDVDAVHVLDPVFLKSSLDYKKLINKNEKIINQPYLAYYLLNPDSFRKKIINYVKNDKGIQIEKNIYTNEKFSFRKPSLNINKFKFKSFSSWLSLIQNAEFMITDSFHGLAFAIIFNKQFICIANKSRGAARMESILKLLNLTDRLVYEGQEIDSFLKQIKKINYLETNEKLEKAKVKSLMFLESSLS